MDYLDAYFAGDVDEMEQCAPHTEGGNMDEMTVMSLGRVLSGPPVEDINDADF